MRTRSCQLHGCADTRWFGWIHGVGHAISRHEYSFRGYPVHVNMIIVVDSLVISLVGMVLARFRQI